MNPQNKEEHFVAQEIEIATMMQAGDILCAARDRADQLGKMTLCGAYVYLHAAMLADFVRAAEQPEWIGPEIQMSESSVKPTSRFLMEHLFGVLFKPLLEKGGAEFLDAVRVKAEIIIDERLASPTARASRLRTESRSTKAID